MEISAAYGRGVGAAFATTSQGYKGGGSGGASEVPSLFFPKDKVSIGKDEGEGNANATYGPDGMLVSANSQKETDSATIAKLKERDQNVRDTEKAKGEAVGNAAYIYQIGPDGQKYAIGTAPHAVMPKGSTAEEEGSVGGATATSAASPSMQAEKGHENSAAPKSPEENEDIKRLENRDSEVKAHEAAHIAASGGGASTPIYDYQTGPDGKAYAIGGSVNITTTNVPGNPEASRQNANALERAAMAPGEPSAQDYRVAAEARKMRGRADDEEKQMRGLSF